MAAEFSVLLAAFVMGLMGSGHCLGMCGGLMSALAFQIEGSSAKRFILIFAYNIGRIASYVVIAAIFAVLLQIIPKTGFPIGRTVAGLLMIAMGFYISGIWRALKSLERIGGVLWQKIKPLGNRFMPVKHLGQALILGAIWGWLPCGLVYSALAYASAQNSVSLSLLAMLCFGLGTLPAVLMGGMAATTLRHLLANKAARWVFAFAYFVFGVWTIVNAWQHLGHSAHQHGSHIGHQHTQTAAAEAQEILKDNLDSQGSTSTAYSSSSQAHQHHHH